MRVKQKEGTRGSLMFIQQLITRRPQLIAERLAVAGVVPPGVNVEWRSPLEADDWAEYRDSAFLERIGHAELASELKDYWPTGGPQWDGLAVVGDTVLLIEAKAHVGELGSSCAAKAPAARRLIEKSLGATKLALGAEPNADWMSGYYQLANRLAHLSFLRGRGVDARLVLLQFTGETGMPTPSSLASYRSAFEGAMKHLGLDKVSPVPGLVEVYIDVAELS
jgi:hypothetical protein